MDASTWLAIGLWSGLLMFALGWLAGERWGGDK